MGANPKIDPNDPAVKKFLKEMKRRNMTQEDVGKLIRGMRVKPSIEPVIHDYGSNRVRIGVVSDNHLGNRFTDIPFLHFIYKRFKEEGVSAVYNAGDLTDGQNMHKDQREELYAYGISNIVKEIVEKYPSIEGVTTHYIMGNHDKSYLKDSGTHLGKLLETMKSTRPDLNYIGGTDVGGEGIMDRGLVLLGPQGKTKMVLVHPGGGTAYAQSYNQQRQIENLISDIKPNLMFYGHYHKLDYLFYRNVHAFQTGTTEDQTAFMASKNLVPQKGALVIDIHMKDSGEIDKLRYKVITR